MHKLLRHFQRCCTPLFSSLFERVSNLLGEPTQLNRFELSFVHAASYEQLLNGKQVWFNWCWNWENFSEMSFSHHLNQLQDDAMWQLRHSLSSLISQNQFSNFPCDIREISGFSSSKSEGIPFESIERFIEVQAPAYIKNMSVAGMEDNLTHKEIRIISEPSTTTDRYVYLGWLGRIFLTQVGGSHHMGAAVYIAKKLGVSRIVPANLTTYQINPAASQELISPYHMLIVPRPRMTAFTLHSILRDIGIRYAIGHVSVYGTGLNPEILFFPKTSRLASRAADILRSKGLVCVNELLSKAVRQSQNLQPH